MFRRLSHRKHVIASCYCTVTEPCVLANWLFASDEVFTEKLNVPIRVKQRPAVSLLANFVLLSNPIPIAFENPFRQETA